MEGNSEGRKVYKEVKEIPSAATSRRKEMRFSKVGPEAVSSYLVPVHV